MRFYRVEEGQIIEIDVRRIRRLRDEPAKEVIYLSSAHLHLQLLYEALFRVWTGTILLQKIILTSQPRALLLYHIKHTALHCEQFLVKVAVNIPIYLYHRSFILRQTYVLSRSLRFLLFVGAILSPAYRQQECLRQKL